MSAKKEDSIQKHFAKSVLLCLLAFFLIPVISLVFTQHGLNTWDSEFIGSVMSRSRMSSAEKEELRTFLTANPPSKACAGPVLDPVDNKPLYNSRVCAPYAERWQFYQVGQLSKWLIIGGIIGVLFIALLGLIAFTNRKLQYISFVTGWRLLIVACVVEIIAQGVIITWLSFWLTAFFFNSYVPKLILVIGLFVAIGVFYALVSIFKRLPPIGDTEGELLSRIDAPALWARVDALAKKLKTQAPDQIIAGIDDNFYVTESPIKIQGKTLKGRTLYISIPLLRILDTSEADSVLAHELNHLRGGDTTNSAALGPKLFQYDMYCAMMYDNGATRLVYYPLHLYRLIFEFALKRESRQREYMADRTAAKAVSPQAIIHSLVKISAYSSYRTQTENQLFSSNQRHDERIGISDRVASGLHDYARSENFVQDIQAGHVPHPFDSHPALPERMKNAGYNISPTQFGDIVTQPPMQTWVDLIPVATQIEQRLWSKYEQDFGSQHEHVLAYRYEPANAQEEQIVLKYFPPVTFELKKDQSIQITYAGIVQPKTGELLGWDMVKGLNYTDGYGSDTLTITHPEKKMIGNKTTAIKLPGIAKQRDQFKNTLGMYWERHQVMRAEQAAAAQDKQNEPPSAA